MSAEVIEDRMGMKAALANKSGAKAVVFGMWVQQQIARN
jgi:hypothetical protein